MHNIVACIAEALRFKGADPARILIPKSPGETGTDPGDLS